MANTQQAEHILFMLKDDRNLPILEQFMKIQEVNAETRKYVEDKLEVKEIIKSLITIQFLNMGKALDDKDREERADAEYDDMPELLEIPEVEPEPAVESKPEVESKLEDRVNELIAANKELAKELAISEERYFNNFIINYADSIGNDAVRHILNDTSFEIYQETLSSGYASFNWTDDDILLKNPISVRNLLLFCIGNESIDTINRIAARHKFTDFASLVCEFLTEFYFENCPGQINEAIEFFNKVAPELEFEKSIMLAYARFLIQRYEK